MPIVLMNMIIQRYKYYDPETGRFLSCDPLFEKFDKFTPYHYAYNSPVQFKDPSGLSAEDEKGDKVQMFKFGNYE